MRAQRRGNATDHHIRLPKPAKIGGGRATTRRAHLADEIVAQMVEIIPPGLQGVYLALINVESQHRKPRLEESAQQRQADVPQPDHADDGGGIFNFGSEGSIGTVSYT